jgi:hypothetical protein
MPLTVTTISGPTLDYRRALRIQVNLIIYSFIRLAPRGAGTNDLIRAINDPKQAGVRTMRYRRTVPDCASVNIPGRTDHQLKRVQQEFDHLVGCDQSDNGAHELDGKPQMQRHPLVGRRAN